MAKPRLPRVAGRGGPAAPRALRVSPIIAAALLVTGSGTGVADSGTALPAAEESGIVRRVRPRAEAGDAASQFLLGNLYFQGDGVPRDLEASIRWYQAAAEQGHPLAQHNLGNAHMNGHGVAADDLEAMRWWRRAGEQDVAAAQFNLGLHLYYGRGGSPDQAAARRWIERAASNGHELARKMLGDLQPAPQPASGAGAPDGPLDERWVRAQDPAHYTLQLLSTTQEPALRAFVARHDFDDTVASFRYERGGQALIGLVHGAYATPSEARAASDRVRRAVVGIEPWIRRLRSVQHDIGDDAPDWSSP